jgi:hypothetical protein
MPADDAAYDRLGAANVDEPFDRERIPTTWPAEPAGS